MTNLEPSIEKRDSGNYHLYHDWGGGTELSTTIVLAVQHVSGDDFLEQDPLAPHIDPDALDRLFAPCSPEQPRNVGEITFVYAGYSITVRASGAVILSPLSSGDVDGG